MSVRRIKAKKVHEGMYIHVPSTGFYGTVESVKLVHDGIVIITFIEEEVYHTYDDEVLELIVDDSESTD